MLTADLYTESERGIFMTKEQRIATNPSMAEKEKVRQLAQIYKNKLTGTGTLICAGEPLDSEKLEFTMVVHPDDEKKMFDEHGKLREGVPTDSIGGWIQVFTSWNEADPDRRPYSVGTSSCKDILNMLKGEDSFLIEGFLVNEDIWIPKDMLV